MAQRQLYKQAKSTVVLQLIVTLAIPLVGAAITLVAPSVEALVAFASLMIAVLDIAVLDRIEKAQLLSAAKAQEQFDCTVLDLPWDSYNVGPELEPETIHGAASGLVNETADGGLVDWYPPIVGQVPIHQGRLICQRTNLWYDSKLRRRYGTLILSTIACLAVALVAIGIAGGMTMTSFVLVVVAPGTPFVSWGLREFYRQRDAADSLDRLRNEAEALWRRAKVGGCGPEDCALESRVLQTAIFNKRSTSPPVFNWIYRRLRLRTEDQMNDGAAQMVGSLAPLQRIEVDKQL
jgi:hypothetical protein